MTIAFDEFKPRTMTRTINQIKSPPRLLRDLFFGTRNTNPTSTIDVDLEIAGCNVLPFVTDVEGGMVVGKTKREMRSVKTPRIRVKKPFPAPELLDNRPLGSGIYAAGSPSQERQRILSREMAELKKRASATEEYLCSQALTGTVSIDQDNISQTVDYNIPVDHQPTLASGSKWTEDGGDPLSDIQTWTDLMTNSAIGMAPDILVMGTTAAAAFLDKVGDSKWFDSRRVAAGQVSWKASSHYLGNVMGIDCYRYGGKITTHAGVSTSLLAADKIILGASQARFSIEFGSIQDLEAGNIVMEYFSKSWIEKDPSLLWILAETRPLPVLWQPEAIIYGDVC